MSDVKSIMSVGRLFEGCRQTYSLISIGTNVNSIKVFYWDSSTLRAVNTELLGGSMEIIDFIKNLLYILFVKKPIKLFV